MLKLPQNKSDYAGFAKYTSEMWRDLDTYYAYWVERWRRTLDYIRGHHWKALQELDIADIPEWKQFPVVNFTMAMFNEFTAQLAKSRVRYSATAASPDPQDVAAAELMEQLFRYLWDELDMHQKRIDMHSWQAATGTGYLRYFWDTNTGNMVPLGIPTPDGGIIPVDPETLQIDPSITEPIEVDAGEIGVEAISPQFVRWGHKPADGVMVGLMLSYDEAATIFNEKAAEDLSYGSSGMKIYTDLGTINTPMAHNLEQERALVIQHYIPRNSRYPNGVWWTADGKSNRLLTPPNPLPSGVLPIASYRWIPVPGHHKMGMSPLYDITFTNKQYDKALAKIQEWNEKVLPKVLLKSGGGVTYGTINDEPFQEIMTHSGAEPSIMEVRQVPSTFYQALNQAQGDTLSLSGHAFPKDAPETGMGGMASTRFRNPTNVNLQDVTKLAQLNAMSGWKESGKIMIAYVSEFYTEPRVIAVQGPDRAYQWKEFIGAELRNASATIHVDEVALYPWNREEMRNVLTAFLDTQTGPLLLADEKGGVDTDRLRNMLNAAGIDLDVGSVDPDVMEARNEQMMFESFRGGDPSQLPKLQPWQNDIVHHNEHGLVLKSRRYQAWHPAAQQAFLQHHQETEQRINQAAQAEAEAMIEQERQLRTVREQAELQHEIQGMAVEALIEPMKEALRQILTEGEETEPKED